MTAEEIAVVVKLVFNTLVLFVAMAWLAYVIKVSRDADVKLMETKRMLEGGVNAMSELDLEPIRQRLVEAKRQRPYEEADRHEAKSKAWSDFYQHAPSDVELLVSEVERLRSIPLIRVGPNADTLAFSCRRQEEKRRTWNDR